MKYRCRICCMKKTPIECLWFFVNYRTPLNFWVLCSKCYILLGYTKYIARHEKWQILKHFAWIFFRAKPWYWKECTIVLSPGGNSCRFQESMPKNSEEYGINILKSQTKKIIHSWFSFHVSQETEHFRGAI